MLSSPSTLLEGLLEGRTLPGLADLDVFVEQSRKGDGRSEGQFLELKSGETPESSLKKKIKRNVNAFANSEGGVLIVGYENETGQRKPLLPRAGEGWAVWAETVCQEFASFLFPPPVFEERKEADSGKTVLVIAVARAPQLFPIPEDGRFRYYLRFGQMTLRAPEYLIADLTLGRRRGTLLRLACPKIQFKRHSDGHWRYWLTFVVENLGLFHADQVEIGMVAESHEESSPRISEGLLNYLKISRELLSGVGCIPKVWEQPVGPIFRFSSSETVTLGPINSYPRSRRADFKASIGVYLMSQDNLPAWYQYSFEVDQPDAESAGLKAAKTASWRRCHGSRPVVGVQP